LSDIAIRPATSADADAIRGHLQPGGAKLDGDVRPGARDARRATPLPDCRDHSPVPRGRVDGRVAGWSSLARWSARGGYDQTVESSIYIIPETQREGVGLALAGAALAAAAHLDVHAVIAQIWRRERRRAGPRRAVGFVRVGVLREVGPKFGRALDVVACSCSSRASR